jgi:hypothetical protein
VFLDGDDVPLSARESPGAGQQGFEVTRRKGPFSQIQPPVPVSSSQNRGFSRTVRTPTYSSIRKCAGRSKSLPVDDHDREQRRQVKNGRQ